MGSTCKRNSLHLGEWRQSENGIVVSLKHVPIHFNDFLLESLKCMVCPEDKPITYLHGEI